MRITNKMMTNNSMYNINNNKNLLNTLESQYSTGKKITRPSDDPIVAVRALKFRTNLTEVQQYTGKNIPDALNWMEVTESSLETINEIIRSMNTPQTTILRQRTGTTSLKISSSTQSRSIRKAIRTTRDAMFFRATRQTNRLCLTLTRTTFHMRSQSL